ASPAGRKRAAWPWALAGAVVVGGGVAAAVAVFGKGGPGPGPGGSTTTGSDALPAPSADTSALERTVLSRQFALGKSAYPVVPIVEGDGAGKWHARLSYKGDRPVSVQWVRPSGAIASELTFERGADGTETIHSFDGYHVEQWTRVVSPDGVSTTTDRSGVVSSSGCYRVRRTYDAQGNLAEEACLSPTGVPIADSTGCQVRRYGYDERRLQTSDSCLGYDGSGKDVKPAPNANGIHLVKYHYDAEGNRSDEGYFDVMGAAVARISDGCFGVKLEHDAAGNQTGIACVDASGGRRKVMGQQAASSRTEPDANGCSLKITYQDVPGKPATWGLVAFQTWQVDAQCNVLREESRGPDGKPIAPEGTKVAATSYEYDDKGRVTMRRCFGADLAPTNCENTGAQIGVVTRYSHDERGRRTSERYYTADDKPSAQSHSYPHETRTSYGDDGRVSAFAFFDEQGKPAVALGGVARMAYRYDALGGEVSQSYFGASGEPIDSSVGCHELRRSYDERHRIESIECRAASGELKAHANMILHGVTWPAGAARVTVSRGEFIENAFWAPNGNPVSKIDCRSEATPCHR
ncbi:MAG: hypothetical protein HY908_37890, partial [Myxococcales bacterium]|nr:hypothetical protein [Myxococcales bacterium]